MLERLCAKIPLAAFLDRHYATVPYAESASCREWVPIATAARLSEIACRGKEDVVLAKDGARAETFRGAVEDLERALAAGSTVVVKHAQRHDPLCARLAEDLARDVPGPVDVHLVWTPEGAQGYGWHYDAEEVFLLQLAGSKRYFLRKNTVDPHPLVRAMPDPMPYDRETSPVTMDCRLESGDWLHVPSGWWHAARAESPSVSLSVGVLSPAGIDLLDDVRDDLARSPIWRRRLRPWSRPGESDDERARRVRREATALGAELAEALTRAALARTGGAAAVAGGPTGS